MSVYNESEDYIKESVESILRQSFGDFEFIIVCDNPENVTINNLLMEYKKKDSRIKIIRNEKNFGLATSLNKAFKESTGKYIFRMDADDISVTNRLELQMKYFEQNSSCDILASDRIDLDEYGNTKKSNYKVPKNEKQFIRLMKYGCVINHPSVAMKREVLEKLKGYNNLSAAQDYDLWLRAIGVGFKIKFINEKLIYYRIRSEGISLKNPYKQFYFQQYAKKMSSIKNNYKKQPNSVKLSQDSDETISLKAKKFNRAHELLSIGISETKNKSVISGTRKIVNAIFIDYQIAVVLFNSIMLKASYVF